MGRQQPYIVTVGGMDPTGGAGLVRDYLTAEALGAVPILVGTAWAEQSARGVRSVEPRPAADVVAALKSAVERAPRGLVAVKIGMVATAAIAEALGRALEGVAVGERDGGAFHGPVVFDPVLAASSGGALFEGGGSVLTGLLPIIERATLITPNAAEAAVLTGMAVRAPEEALRAGRRLRESGAAAVLVKGGHLAGHAIDVLVTDQGERMYSAPRAPGPSPRGTGCALATAIAVGLARGETVATAVETAKAWVLERIRAARTVGDERHL